MSGDGPRRALPAELLARLPFFCGPRCLLAFDFDGTLAPIVSHPVEAALPAGARERLARLAERRTCAVLSGRALADVRARLAGVPLAALAGNHGAELWVAARAAGELAHHGAPQEPVERMVARVAGWAAQLAASLAGLPGVRVEDKRLSLSVHYREARDPDRARRAIEAATAALHGARAFGGHCVVNVVGAHAPCKGDALATLLARLSCDAALYVGDDLTDEDVFLRAGALPLLGVRIGPVEHTAAEFTLPSYALLEPLLDALLDCVSRASA